MKKNKTVSLDEEYIERFQKLKDKGLASNISKPCNDGLIAEVHRLEGINKSYSVEANNEQIKQGAITIKLGMERNNSLMPEPTVVATRAKLLGISEVELLAAIDKVTEEELINYKLTKQRGGM